MWNKTLFVIVVTVILVLAIVIIPIATYAYVCFWNKFTDLEHISSMASWIRAFCNVAEIIVIPLFVLWGRSHIEEITTYLSSLLSKRKTLTELDKITIEFDKFMDEYDTINYTDNFNLDSFWERWHIWIKETKQYLNSHLECCGLAFSLPIMHIKGRRSRSGVITREKISFHSNDRGTIVPETNNDGQLYMKNVEGSFNQARRRIFVWHNHQRT